MQRLLSACAVAALFSALAAPIDSFAAPRPREKSSIPDASDESRRGDMLRMAKKAAVERFDAADKNKDGKLSAEECQGPPPGMGHACSNLPAYDADGDGEISRDELLNFKSPQK